MPTDHRAVLAKIKRFDQLIVELKHGFTAGNHDQALLSALTPNRLDLRSQPLG